MKPAMKALRGSTSVWALAIGASAALLATAAHADVTISSGKTKNMTCSSGRCSPTANKAVLNVSDLETMLASGNATVTTTGSGSVQATYIDIAASLTWSSSSVLTLDADPPNGNLVTALNISAPVSVTGTGGLTINDPASTGWTFNFTGSGDIAFANVGGSV
jgi:hypothetical protein